MADRKSNRRKKVESTAPLSNQASEASETIEPPKEEKRKFYPSTVISIGWDALNTKRRINDDLKTEISDLYYDVQKKPSAQISKILELVEKYPDIQIFQGYLLMAYILEEDARALDVAVSLNKKYPDFMLGKIGFVESCLHRNELDSIPGFLDEKYDFKDIFPQRGSFHIVEVLHFYFSLGRFFALTGQADLAKSYYKEIKTFDEESALLKKLQKDIDKGSGVKFYQKIFRKFRKES